MIYFIESDGRVKIRGKRKLASFLLGIAQHYGYKVGQLNYQAIGLDEMVDMHQEYFNDFTLTDIITFGEINGGVIEGDIAYNLDYIARSGSDFGQGLQSEWARVMIHGLLHIVGFNDLVEEERDEMRKQEDYWLGFFPFTDVLVSFKMV